MSADLIATAEQLRQLSDDLKQAGYRAELNDDRIISSMGGYEFEIYLYPNKTIQFATGFSRQPLPNFGLEQVNGFNSTYRFSKVYLDEDDDVVLSTDFVYDWDLEDRGTILRKITLLHEASQGFLMSAFQESDKASPEA